MRGVDTVKVKGVGRERGKKETAYSGADQASAVRAARNAPLVKTGEDRYVLNVIDRSGSTRHGLAYRNEVGYRGYVEKDYIYGTGKWMASGVAIGAFSGAGFKETEAVPGRSTSRNYWFSSKSKAESALRKAMEWALTHE